MEEASLQQINIKTPEFMETAVNGWFSILEAQFHLRNITASTTKFYTVISSLPAEVVAKIPITILESKKYEEIKQSLIEAHERTKPELLDKLMSTTTITGRPSTYLQEMLSIAKRIGIGEEIVIHKFLQALPATIFPVIASQKELSPTQLGKLADELMPLLNNINATAFTLSIGHKKLRKAKTILFYRQVLNLSSRNKKPKYVEHTSTLPSKQELANLGVDGRRSKTQKYYQARVHLHQLQQTQKTNGANHVCPPEFAAIINQYTIRDNYIKIYSGYRCKYLNNTSV